MTKHRIGWIPLAALLATACGEEAAETGEMPMDGMPAAGMPMEGMPMGGMPAAGMPMEGMPMQMRPSVTIVQPADGSTVTGPNVTVQFAVTNFRIAPAGTMEAGTGHHHLFVDVEVSPLDVAIPAGVPGIIHKGMGQTDHVIEGLAPGRHRLIAVVADGLHVPINPPMADTVTFTVAP